MKNKKVEEIDAWQLENSKLKKELEQKNRELEIEAALERVRARTMAMQNSDELAEVSYLLNKQVVELGIPTRGCAFNIYGEDESKEWFSNLDGTLPTYKTPRENIFLKYYEGGKRGETLLIEEFGKERIRQHYEYMYSLGLLGNNEDEYKTIAKAMPESQIDHVAYFKYGYLLFITLAPAPESHDIFKRFAKEFEQTYTRFLDLQKAEAQAREAQIEAALERVRAASMAMHQTEDIGNVVQVYFEQLKHLDIPFAQAWITILKLEEGYFDTWFSPIDGIYDTPAHFKMPSAPFEDTTIKNWRLEVPTSYLSLKTKSEVEQFLFACDEMTNSTYFSHIQDKLKMERLEFLEVRHKFGFISKTTFEPPAKEEEDILMRFAKVFEQTYTRFLDLKKAEAQAREAQIEAALERVRARAMAMHDSSEMLEVADVLFQQIRSLGGELWGCGVVVCHGDQKDDEVWFANEKGVLPPIAMSHTEDPTHQSMYDGWKNKLDLFTHVEKGQELQKHYNYMLSVPSAKPLFEEIQASGMSFPNWQKWHAAYFSRGYLLIITLKPYEEVSIFTRFAKVFDQAYTRFLDLQKAEAQAKEAKIEAALEKIRSRTMGMQSSDELPEVANLLFTQVRALGIHAWSCGYNILADDNKTATCCMSSEGTLQTPFQLRLWGEASFEEMGDFIRSDKTMLVQELEGQAIEAHYAYMKSFSDLKPTFDEIDRLGLSLPTYQINHLCKFTRGFILFITYEKVPNAHDIFRRFTNVFDQTYTRFLDLQKAEAQAREAQINLAVERVRASALAMHKSEEILNVVAKLKDEVMGLDITGVVAATIFLEADNDNIRMWDLSSLEHSDQGYLAITDITFKLKKTDPHLYIKRVWENPKDYYVDMQNLKDLDRIIEFMYENNQFEVAKEVEFYTKSTNLKQLYHAAKKLNKGKLCIDLLESPPEEMESILNKMGAAFDLAYKRFEDIKKAEAQARESKIQLSLERVRARSLAMKSSDELHEVLSVLFRQFDDLGIKPVNVFLSLFDTDKRTFTYRASGKSGKRIPGKQVIEVDSIEILKALYDKWLTDNSDTVEVIYYPKEVLPELFSIFAETFSAMPKEDRMGVDDYPDGGYSMAGYTPFGYLGYDHQRQATEEEKEILSRFCIEFSRVYQRFLDIQKAEKQAREAQIEVALERVRSRAMAMHHPSELTDVLTLLFEQLDQLGVKTAWTHLTLIDLEKNSFTYRMTGREGKRVTAEQVVDIDAMDVWKHAAETFKSEKPDSITRIEFTPEMLPTVWKIFDGIFSVLPEGYKIYPEDFPNGLFTTQANCKFGYLGINQSKKATEEEEKILGRFGNEFGRLYQRFLDLQKAEAQAKEARIEAALEKVRARSLAMHNSNEMQSVANAVYDQLIELGIEIDAVGMSGVIEAHKDYDVWIGGSPFSEPIRIPFNESTKVQRDYNEVIEQRPELFAKTYSGEIKKEYIDHLLQHGIFSEDLKKKMVESSAFSTSISTSKNSAIQIVRYTDQPYTVQENEILKRLATVFEQAFIRFMDLQKSEAQAREAQIETALERVRARSMGMHQTNELNDVLCVLLEQFDFLGINPVLTHLTLFDEANEKFSLRLTTSPTSRILVEQIIDIYAVDSWKASYENWKKGVPNTVDCIDYPPEVLPAVWEVLSEVMNALPEGHKINPDDFPDGLFTTQGHFKFGYLGFNHSRRATEEEKNIVSRFATEFGRAYQRFLEIQKAEAQAREAQIEAALERVRSRTLAMQKSDELAETAAIFFQQLIQLGIEPNRLYIGIIKDNSSIAEFWTTEEDGTKISTAYTTDLLNNASFKKMYESWRKKEKSTVVDIKGQELKEYIEYLSSLHIPFKDGTKQTRRIQYLAYFSKGFIGMASPDEQPRESMEILERFAYTFNLTFTRFNDLKKAEIRARESQIETALERVRSRTMGMQQSEELGEVASVLFNEMNGLVDDLWTCGFVLCEENRNEDEWWLSMDTGFTRGLFLPNEGDFAHETLYEGWQKGISFRSVELEGKKLNDHYEWLMNIPIAKQIFAEMEASGIPRPKWQKLHAAYFKTGYLVIITEIPCDEEEIFKRFAQVFDLTYTRFLDLQQKEEQGKKLVEEKIRLEGTLKDLQATQTQLIHAEKMASLGELTAGIAHEIQNPLNFVNNFSEVSKELLEEMMEELKNGDIEEVEAIAKDIIENLEKINHHGKRADGIVKGMLQHSRTSSGTKEPTDINVLADEYFRLAYHGLRAKDKSFNATMKSEFDESIGNIEVIPQDIGRVILNLITNAFYAVTEKKKQLKDNATVEGYEPTVVVCTKKIGKHVEILVEDNGKGIPQKLIDKIFQPFFTTKPTGEGTGLGLSLSYDIVKAHGGELKVETKEAEGTTFIIKLPKN